MTAAGAGAAKAGTSAPVRPFVRRFASGWRIARPGIAAGVTLSGLAGMVLAGRGMPASRPAFAGLSCILLAACGSAVVNGILDAETDARMPRLAARVAALEKVGKKGAWILSLALILCALAAAAALLNAVFTGLLLAAVASYTMLYTLVLKRRSPYGTIPGGIPGALPVLVGYAAVEPGLGADGVLLFLLMLLWQPPHFWALALKCREEYRCAGVPALPVAMGEPYTKVLIFLYAAALLPLSLGFWWLGVCSARFAAAALALWVFFFASCCRNVLAAPEYGRAFRASVLYIMGLLLAVVADLALRYPR